MTMEAYHTRRLSKQQKRLTTGSENSLGHGRGAAAAAAEAAAVLLDFPLHDLFLMDFLETCSVLVYY